MEVSADSLSNLISVEVQHQHQNEQDFHNESGDQGHSLEFNSNEDQQKSKDPFLETEHIQDVQISESNVTIKLHLNNDRHYSSYFFEQADFKDYTTSNTMPRAPKLFSGKQYVS